MPFFFNDTATTEIYTLSLHDALPISIPAWKASSFLCGLVLVWMAWGSPLAAYDHTLTHQDRSEEHTSELQSQSNVVCRLLLEIIIGVSLVDARSLAGIGLLRRALSQN